MFWTYYCFIGMATTEFDYLIIGQGLAGSILAHQLITQGQRVMVLDNDHQGSSSTVAAGIINPVTGPRLNCPSSFSNYFDVAKSYYAKLEYHIKANVFNEVKQLRQIQNDSEQAFLAKRLNEPRYQCVLNKSTLLTSMFKASDLPTVEINGTAIIDTKSLLSASKVWLKSLYSYQNTKVNYENFSFSKEFVSYQNIRANTVIFCEGYQAIHNPWLKHLPFTLAKGEILTLENLSGLSTMHSWGKWLTPNGASMKLGSNFDWSGLELTPNTNIKNALLTDLNEHTNFVGDVLCHEVGIRPSTQAREPFIGAIPALDNAYCFNGFGSKGCLLIPFYSSLLTEHFLNQTELPKKVTRCL